MKNLFTKGRPATTAYTPAPDPSPPPRRALPVAVRPLAVSKPPKAKKPKKAPERFAIIDYAAAKAAGKSVETLSSGDRPVLVAANAELSSTKKGKKAPLYMTIKEGDTDALYFMMGLLAQKYNSNATIHCTKDMVKSIRSTGCQCKVCPLAVTTAQVHKKHIPSPTVQEPVVKYTLPVAGDELEHAFVQGKMGKAYVQPLKEKIERKWLKNIKCTVLLGGSLKKGVATRDSDVDLVVIVSAEDLEEAEEAVKQNVLKAGGDTRRLTFHNNIFLAIVKNELGSVDITVKTETKLDEELKWFADISQKFPSIKRAIVLIKVWAVRNELEVPGHAIEYIAARACEVLGKEAALTKILVAIMQRLALGKKTFVSLPIKVRDRDEKYWRQLKAAATAQLEAFKASA
eukprot:TRINITY_DN9602_c0_g4_i1.p1 TRINITY_DN9602_c0_g4~~TRINITY_DN9602_c0_g4_i1.p1  ORF type:complete len:401 (+),score=66.54 TRINITY_DN9602_c0_g4_i1:815-2017(+)